jgi:peroxiredoxin
MKRLQQSTSIQLIIFVFTSLLLMGTTNAANIQGKAPNFTLKSNSGKNIKLTELRGQVILLNFWASWCGPCRQEMPLLEKLQQRYSALGFTVLGVNVEEDPSKAKSLLKDIPVSFPILFDTQNTVSKLYDVSAMPSTVMIDRDGNMRYLHKGYKPGDEAQYKKWVKQLVKE